MKISAKVSLNQYIFLFTTFLSVVVVLLGAFCRLADAGLGCPDWPGCYGHLLTVPQTIHEVGIAAANYPNMPPLSPERMWPEMIHRYFAGSLGLLIILLAFKNFISKGKNNLLFVFLISLVVFQALLGMWTVTWKLHPVVVMGHLLGGFTITGMLWWLTLSYWLPNKSILNITNKQAGLFLKLTWVMTIFVFLQIFLGGWTSSNYAALICPDFPFCNGVLLPEMDFNNGFSMFIDVGKNYEFGLLGESARVAIHMMHRFGAVLVSLIIIFCSLFIMKKNKNGENWIFYWLFLVLFLQIMLGVLNIKLLLPIDIAVSHNGLGLLLFLSCLSCCYFIKKKK